MIGDGENVGNKDALSVDETSSALVGSTAKPVDPKFGANYALTEVSPAVNTGSNSFAESYATDVFGDDRIVGEYVDMGAVEYDVVAPDLTFDSGDVLSGWFASIDGVSMGRFAEGWDVCFDYVFGNYGNGVVLKSFDYTITVDKLDSNGNKVEGASKVFTRTYGDNVDGYMSEEYWLVSGQTISGYWNLGSFDAGSYEATITLNTTNSVYESDMANNAYTITFDVGERPSLVVTTELDVVDSFDGLTSLREAIAAVGSETTQVISIDKLLVDGVAFNLAANDTLGVQEGAVATYNAGTFSFVNANGESVSLTVGLPYVLTNGETLVWDGSDVATLTSSIADTITFASNVYGKTIAMTNGEFVIDRDMVISVGDDANVTIDAQGASRVFFVAHGDVRLGGLTLVNAKADDGGAIYNAGDLSLSDVSVKSASANNGAGVYNAESASLDLWNVEFVDMNATNDGGAIYNAGDLVANKTTFDGSKAVDGAAVYNLGSARFNEAGFVNGVASDQAGAIYNEKGSLTVVSSIFDRNTAKFGGSIVNYLATASIVDSSFTNNTATSDAGAIDNYGDLDLIGTSFANNKANGFGGAIYNSQSSSKETYTVSLDGATFNKNSASKGGAIYNASKSEIVATGAASSFTGNSAENGGAIYNLGNVDAGSGWSFSNNSASDDGGAIYNAAGSVAVNSANFVGNSANNGAALYNLATVKADSTTFKANYATGSGAAVYTGKGSVALSNSALWLNEAGENGGAIANLGGSTVLRNVTVAANVAGELGGGIYNAATLKAYNTIVASNYAANGVDLYATASTSLYNSLLGVKSDSNKTPAMNKSFTGDAGFAVAPIFENGKVTNNVDLTLVAGSQAVNAGNNSYALDTKGSAIEFDLSGNDRICTALDSVDIGAYEFPLETPSNVVNTNLDVVDSTDGVVSLREAIAYAQRLGKKEVVFDASVTNVILSSTLYVDSDVAIGSDDTRIVLETAKGFDGSVVVVGSENEDANVAFRNVVVTGGDNGFSATVQDNPDLAGGGIRNYANLTLDKVEVSKNTAAYGGGVYNAGALTITNSRIIDNSARYYGGVYNRGELSIDASFVEGNTATYYGGGVGTYAGATISNSVIAANTASLGGGVFAQVNFADLLNSDVAWDVNIINCTIVGNTATGAKSDSLGGGVWANHILNVGNSILYGNSAKAAADLYSTSLTASSVTTLKYSDIGSANVALNGTGMKSVDPMFVNYDATENYSEWNLNLRVGSKMIDAGSDALAVGATDVEGSIRISSKHVDIGAYEEKGNVAPTDVNVTVKEGGVASTDSVGSVIATLDAVDSNAGDSFVYELLDDADGSFALDGDKLVVAKELEAGDYNVVVKATDSGSASVEKSFVVTVTDPAADSYAVPTIVYVGRDVDSNILVEWSTDDLAKEYVVEYRVKGDSEWTSTGALTGTFGYIAGSNFSNGDVVEVRISALASSVKNGSEWSDVSEYAIQDAPDAFKVEKTETDLAGGRAVVFQVASNTNAYAYWKVDWNDGSTTTVVGLSMTQTLSHWYLDGGAYTPTLYVDNEDGLALGTIVINASDDAETIDFADELVEVENVFSTIEPVAVDANLANTKDVAVAAVLNTTAANVKWNAIAESVAVEAQNADTVALVANAQDERRESVAAIEARGEAFAEFASFDVEAEDAAELDVDLNESVFNDEFLNDLFQD